MGEVEDVDKNAVKSVITAFREQKEPFETARFPEQTVLDHAPEEDHLAILSYGASLDYNRDATRMWQNIAELYARCPDWFEPEEAATASLTEMEDVFKDIGIRYYNRDAKSWHENSATIAERFGSWDGLVETANHDAPTMVETLREQNIKYLQGTKIAPFYVTIVHDFVHELDRVWEVDVPVDVHVRKLSTALFDSEYSAVAGYTRNTHHDPMDDDKIRALWSKLGDESDITPWSIDGALWLIGANWTEWGQDFWIETVG